MFLYVSKQTFCKLYRYITEESIWLRMQHFHDAIFTWTYMEIFKSALVYLLPPLENQRSESKTVCGFTIILNFERNYVWKSKSPCILLNKNINFNTNEMKSTIENLTHSFRETKLKRLPPLQNVFCHKVALDAQLMNFFIGRKMFCSQDI